MKGVIFIMKHLYMMRHGQTLFNVRRRIQGSCDSPLTELGIKQAEAAKELIKDIAFDHYYSSTAERASDTLEIVTEGQVPYTRVKGLEERDFGLFEGESEDLNPHFDDFGYDDLFPHYGGERKEDVPGLCEVALCVDALYLFGSIGRGTDRYADCTLHAFDVS